MTRDTQIAEDAALWVNRLDQPAIDTSASAAFDAWMAADPRHRETFTDLQALWHSDTLLEALERSDVAPGVGTSPIAAASRFVGLRRSAPWLAGACAALLAVFFLLPVLLVETYRTGTGNGRTIALADGTQIDLSGDAELTVAIVPWRRDVTLVRGEAFFDVAHERWRPFLVQSGSTAVRVLGTAFNVDRQSATRTAVEVYRGAVTLEAPRDDLVLRRGDRARVVDDRVAAQAPNPEAGLAGHDRPDWTAGWFEAADVPMSVLIAKVQRYSVQPIRLRDPALAALPVSGRFKVSDPARVLKAIRGAYSLDVRQDRDAILILPARDAPRT